MMNFDDSYEKFISETENEFNPKDLKAVITRSHDDDFVQMWFLEDDYTPMKDMRSVPISEGVYKESLRLDNFVFAKVSFQPNEKWDGVFKTMDDYEKFNFHIHDLGYYEISNDDTNSRNIHEAINEGEFWDIVKYIANEEKIFENEVQ